MHVTVQSLNALTQTHSITDGNIEMKSNPATCVFQYMAGGDLRDALDKDKRTELVWYRKGYQIALDIARGLHFLHSHDVSRLNACP